MDAKKQKTNPTIGSLFAGIGGFDLGFENAGFVTKWQVEIEPVCRAVLADRFPHAKQFVDVRECGAANLEKVDVITAGFPCQDISTAGNRAGKSRPGLAGERSGLFFEVIRILREVQPAWVVLENVSNLLAVNDCKDFETVIKSLAECGYVGFFRVLDARYFGVPQGRRRVFLVAGHQQMPPFELLSDAQPVEAIPRTLSAFQESRAADTFATYTLLAKSTPGRSSLGNELFVLHQGRRDKMVERQRISTDSGFCLGLGEADFIEARCAGNAVVPQVAEWVAKHLYGAIRRGE